MRSLFPENIDKYVESLSTVRQTDVERRLRAETAQMKWGGMQIGPDQAAFFAILVRSIGATRALEIGTFTGYSALSIASALAPGGRLVCCDVSEEWTAIARRYWAEAGVADRIELHLRPAQETLAELLRKHGPGSFDFAFIDADKTGYDAYYEACLELLRPGGLIAIDNVLWSGTVADPADQKPDTVALRALTVKIRDDRRVDASLVSLGDGVLLARKL